MSKKNRLNDIIKIIEEQEIDTQEELTEKLVKMGYDVSQATVSRDIKELNLIKSAGFTKKFRYIKAPDQITKISDKIIDLYKQVTLSVTMANNLIVIKTLSGNANTAAMAIDEMRFPQILGTIAGDDAVLIVTLNNTDAEIVIKTLKTL